MGALSATDSNIHVGDNLGDCGSHGVSLNDNFGVDGIGELNGEIDVIDENDGCVVCYAQIIHFIEANNLFKTKHNSNELFKLRAMTTHMSEHPKSVWANVYSGSKLIKTLSLKTDSEGFASCDFSKLPVGEYKVVLVPNVSDNNASEYHVVLVTIF